MKIQSILTSLAGASRAVLLLVALAPLGCIAEGLEGESSAGAEEDVVGEQPDQQEDPLTAGFGSQIPHNQVVHFANNAPDYAQNYKPRLAVKGGCVPFPAVQANGQWSGGLSASGSENGGCSSSVGQIYTRYKYISSRDECAMMYSWYFPKDGNLFAGHRHDWEAVVVWLKGTCKIGGNPIAVAYSAHGGWSVRKGADIPLHDGTGTKIQPKVKYWKSTPVTNYELGATSELGGDQPLIAWPNLTAAARETLNNASFGSAIVPFKDSNFDANITAAKYW